MHHFEPILFLGQRIDFGITLLDVVMDDSGTVTELVLRNVALHRFGPFWFLAHRIGCGFTLLDVVMDDSSSYLYLYCIPEPNTENFCTAQFNCILRNDA